MKHIKNNWFCWLSIIFFLFLSATSINAATYYVDQNHPQASDSNPGTEELPWKTMIHGAAQVRAGDTLLVKNGIYTSQTRPEWYIPGIRIVNSGTPSNPIIIKAYPGHKPVIDGSNVNQYTFGGFMVSNIIIDGFEVRWGIIFFSGDDENLRVSNITIQNCELVYGLTNFGDPGYTNMIEFRFLERGIVRNCVIHGNKFNRPDWGRNRAAIVLHWTNDIIVENNLFYDNHIAYKNKIGNSGVSGLRNVFRYNIIKDCSTGADIGGYTDTTRDSKIIQNIFINVDIGVHIDSGNTRLVVANNVFYADPGFNPPGDSTSGIFYWSTTSQDNQIYNNIIVNLESPITNYAHSTQWPPGLYIDYNNYSNFIGFDQYWTYLTFAQFKSRVGNNNYVILNQDPRFVNPANRDFRLQSTSPCLIAGIDRQDYDGDGNTTERINMGAYITGNEIIGLLYSNPANPPPAPPTITGIQ